MNPCHVAPDGPRALDLIGRISRNPDKLRPPTGAMTVLRLGDLMVTVVGGPNSRNDYHINPTEELFFQLEGTATLRNQHSEQYFRSWVVAPLRTGTRVSPSYP